MANDMLKKSAFLYSIGRVPAAATDGQLQVHLTGRLHTLVECKKNAPLRRHSQEVTELVA